MSSSIMQFQRSDSLTEEEQLELAKALSLSENATKTQQTNQVAIRRDSFGYLLLPEQHLIEEVDRRLALALKELQGVENEETLAPVNNEEEEIQLALVLSELNDESGTMQFSGASISWEDTGSSFNEGWSEGYLSEPSEARASSRNESRSEDREEMICVICQENESTYLYVPCGHRVICSECIEEVRRQELKECPVCRTTADDIISRA